MFSRFPFLSSGYRFLLNAACSYSVYLAVKHHDYAWIAGLLLFAFMNQLDSIQSNLKFCVRSLRTASREPVFPWPRSR
jgi:hypothetical protein